MSTYTDLTREPSVPHQCMHTSDSGRRCRARSMHNNYMCFAHRSDSVPPVIENEPFDIRNLSSPLAIQQALANVAARLACNRIDLKRAGLLVYTLQAAASNLDRLCAPGAAEPPEPSAEATISPDPEPEQ